MSESQAGPAGGGKSGREGAWKPRRAEARASGKALKKAASAAKRARRAERYDALFEPWVLALAGGLSSLAFLFQPELGFKLVLFALFLLAALASGKKVSLGATLFVSLGIVAANLLVPVGRVLWRIGPAVITESALLDGIAKAVTFEGLIYISKASIRPGLRIPGRFGGIVAAAFVYYDRIVEYKGRIRVQSLFEDVDALMLAISEKVDPHGNPEGAVGRGSRAGRLIAAAAVLACAAALALGWLFRKG
jgi:hypothetical protein